jgi:hypothetical protein
MHTQIFWAPLKKSSLSLDRAWALLKMSSPSPPKNGEPRDEPEPGLGSDPSLSFSLKKTSLTVFGVRFCILISEEGTMRKNEKIYSVRKKSHPVTIEKISRCFK